MRSILLQTLPPPQPFPAVRGREFLLEVHSAENFFDSDFALLQFPAPSPQSRLLP